MQGVIVGFGTIAMGHVAGYSELTEMSVGAVVDPSPERRACAESSFGLASYRTIDEMMRHESPDFIDVCAPPHAHAGLIRQGLAHGLHVLCEKPVFVPSEEGYEVLIAEIAATDRIVYPCHNYKFAPILGLMQQVVTAPEFGTVLGAQFRTLRSGHAVGVPEWDPHWRRNSAISAGGILRDHGPHSIYLATHLTGRTPVAVSCLTGNLRRDEYESTEDTALLTVRCDDGSQIGLDLTWSGSYRRSCYSISGTAGTIVVENDDVYYTVRGEVVRTRLPSEFDDPSHRGWFGRMFLDFADVVNNPRRQGPLVREALMTSLVIDAGYESARRQGAWIDVRFPDVVLRGER